VTDSARQARRQLLSRGSVYTASTFVQLLGGVLVYPLLTRSLRPAELGAVAAASLVLRLVSALATLGLHGAVTREYFDGPDGPTEARRLVPTAALVAGGIALLAHLTGPFWSATFEGIGYGPMLTFAVACSVPAAVVATCQAQLRAGGRTGAFVLVSLASGLGSVLLGIVAVVVLAGEPVNYFQGLLLGDVLACLLALILSRAAVRPASTVVVRRALAFGLPTVPHALALIALGLSDRIVIERVLGLEAVGRYQVAYLVGNLVILLLIALNNAWAPSVLGAADGVRLQQLADTSYLVNRLTAVAVVIVAWGAPLALVVAAPASYGRGELSDVAAVVALAGLAYANYQAHVIVLFQERRTGPLALVTPISAAANVVLNILLLPVVGLLGAAAATVATFALQAALVRRSSRRKATVPWLRGSLAPPSLAACALVAVSLVLPTEGAWLVARAGVATAFAAWGAWFVHRLVAVRNQPTALAEPT
jgi:O-antigen/teichoic acid export membrane protein